MLVKIEARILIFPGTDFHFPSTSVPPGTFFGLWRLPRHCEPRGISGVSQSYSQARSINLLQCAFSFTAQATAQAATILY